MSAAKPISRVLVVAGSDSGGGAGLQADIKSILAMGGYAMTAITALTAQNTSGVHSVMPVPADFFRQQMQVVLQDIGADIIKTGMLHRREIIEVVAETWDNFGQLPLVVDPVMVAKGGASLLDREAASALQSLLLPACRLLTPNMPEAAVLMGRDVDTFDDMKRAADWLMDRGAGAVLVKGGHGHERVITDLLAEPSGFTVFETERLSSAHTHGTGCTLASAVAALLGAGMLLPSAVEDAIMYVQEAIKTAPGLGSGHGPLNHRAGLTRSKDKP